jgi:vancomycin resistance protein YoaR
LAGAGADAAIFQPTADFRFQNDTPYHLLIETSVFPGSDAIQVRFYSTNPGRKVIVEQPEVRDIVPALPTVYEVNPELLAGQSLQVDWSAQGASVSVVRIIEDLSGNEIRRETLFTQYQPWAAVIQVAPGDSRLGQSG